MSSLNITKKKTRDSSKENVLTRIKKKLPERAKRPWRSFLLYSQFFGQFFYIPRDAVGAMRNRNAVFLWIPKTAGATLYKALDIHICMKLLDLPSAKLRFRNKGLATFGHMEYAQLVEAGVVGSRFDESAFKFCFSRNPYSRAVSLYFFSAKRGWIAEGLSFLDFCRRIENGVHDIGLFNVVDLSLCNPQVRWLRGVNPDFVGKLEDFDTDLRHIFGSLNLPEPNTIGAENSTVHSSYRDYYCPESIDIVARFYSEDFERFGYSLTL